MKTPASKQEKTTKRRELTGVVVKRSGDKTVSVEVVTTSRHPVYGKSLTHTKRYLSHDPKNEYEVGDSVRILEGRPMSARKRYVVIAKA